ncbi:MAG: hypothetical protein IKF78_15585 [Atopobiaceae bacterium]|nr:hypothetical protein [Atopobiaceae bacterium]
MKTVYSHKQGIAQGSEWLKKNLADAEVVEVASTAEGPAWPRRPRVTTAPPLVPPQPQASTDSRWRQTTSR